MNMKRFGLVRFSLLALPPVITAAFSFTPLPAPDKLVSSSTILPNSAMRRHLRRWNSSRAHLPAAMKMQLRGGADMGTLNAGLQVVFVSAALLGVLAGAAALWVLQSMHVSVGVDQPTAKQLEEEDLEKHALFRHLPVLKNRLAWRQLGTFPTPVHRGTCSARPIADATTDPSTKDSPAETVSFFVKREDLSSSDAYGGNKVRTLQHQLAVMEAKVERGGPQREVLVFGSGGSNQVVATVVHALRAKLPIPVSALWIPDPPDLENTLNMLSSLSFPLKSFVTWGDLPALAQTMLSKLFGGSSFVLPLGGNNPSGVLGQVGGALEFAEQIQAGELPDCDGIYVAVGSSCTISGLVIGGVPHVVLRVHCVALARKLGIKAYAQPGFALHLVPIHHLFALLNRVTGLYTARFSRFIPLTVRHSIHATCAELVRLGGPDVLAEALAVLEEETEVHDDATLAGLYGTHSAPSRAAARLFDESSALTTRGGDRAAGLWLCGHFTAKATAAMCDDLLKPGNAGKNMVLWQTKSRIQPRGPEDEWQKLQGMPPGVQAWAAQGQAQSVLRAGRVDPSNGSAEDYRPLMTEIK